MYPITLTRLSKKRKLMLQLTDEKTVTGQLIDCDVAMNVYMENVQITDIDGSQKFAKQCFLRGSSIKLIKFNYKLMEKQKFFD